MKVFDKNAEIRSKPDDGFCTVIIGESINGEKHYVHMDSPTEEVYASGFDTAGNYHWTGTQSGHHIIKKEENTT